MALDPLSLAGFAAGTIGNLFSGFSARRQANKAEAQARKYEQEVARLEASRQEVVNPYENISDLSSMITNPFANLQVATKAAQMQAAETDISLASTLDVLRATGAGAGGATALAQAALQSKKQVSASIQLQEAQNQKLYAQGEERLNNMRMQEQQRLQSADVMGKQFMFNVEEQRQVAELNRTAGMLDNANQDLRDMRAAEAAAEANMYNSVGQVVGGIGKLIGS